MTRNIEDWLGKKVIYKGIIESWNELRADAGFVLLIKVTLRPYSDDKKENRTEDHFWYKLSGRNYTLVKSVGRLYEVTGLAKVITYIRTDGTKDLGIVPIGANFLLKYTVALDHIKDIINNEKDPDKEFIVGCNYLIYEICLKILHELKQETLVFDIKYSYDSIFKHFSSLLTESVNKIKELDPKFDFDRPDRKTINSVKGLLLYVMDIIKTSNTM